MRPEALEEARDWQARASEDILAAERLLSGPRPLLASAAFHCQQAAEKTLKGYLSAHEVEFLRTHDLVQLLRQCAAVEEEFSSFSDAARLLTPFAVRTRYPGAFVEPSGAEAAQALALARDLVGFVQRRLDQLSQA